MAKSSTLVKKTKFGQSKLVFVAKGAKSNDGEGIRFKQNARSMRPPKAEKPKRIILKPTVEKPAEPVNIQFRPVIMTPQQPPGHPYEGPYCRVLFPGTRQVLRPTGQFETLEQEVTDQKTGKVTVNKVKKEKFRPVDKECLVEQWVRVIKGDERNGFGIVFKHNANVSGTYKGIRFAGGTALSCAKFIEAVEVSSMARN